MPKKKKKKLKVLGGGHQCLINNKNLLSKQICVPIVFSRDPSKGTRGKIRRHNQNIRYDSVDFRDGVSMLYAVD